MKATTNAKPVQLGQEVRSVQIHADALSKAALSYLATPNYPECQDLKISRFEHYQRCLADLMEAAHG
jgi:hypothetical protein